jgi:hypothetical protein
MPDKAFTPEFLKMLLGDVLSQIYLEMIKK